MFKKYLLAVLLTLLACNYVERSVLALALQNIKTDLHLTDTQLGILSGFAFAVFYSFMGLPIARWADRGNRVTILAVTTALWAFMVALCGAVRGFWTLALVRMGVAVGEAGCIPPSHSLIADYFTRAERPRAVSIYMVGGWLSIVIGYFGGGALITSQGWRMAFIILGAAGLPLALLTGVTLTDSLRTRRRSCGAGMSGGADLTPVAGVEPASQPKLYAGSRALWANQTFRHLLLGFSVLFFFAQGIAQWLPSYFVRSYSLGSAQLGTWFALSMGVPGMLGSVLGGEWASRAAAGNEALQLKAIAMVLCFFGAIYAGVYLSSSYPAAFLLIALANFGGATVNGPLFATVQAVVPSHMRAMSIAVIYLFANLLGMGLGPLAVGALSDALHPWVGEESLRYSLLIWCPGYGWAAYHLWLATHTVDQDLRMLEPSAETVIGLEHTPLA